MPRGGTISKKVCSYTALPLPSCPFTKPSEMDLKLLPLPQNQPASVCCDLVHQIDGSHQQERVRDWVQCCTGHMYRHKCTHMYRHSRVKLERKRVVGMVQWSQRCWDQLGCIYENAQWSYTKKKNHGEKLYKENVQQRKALQRKYTAVKSSTKKICSEEKRYKCNQCGGKGAMVTVVLGSVKMFLKMLYKEIARWRKAIQRKCMVEKSNAKKI